MTVWIDERQRALTSAPWRKVLVASYNDAALTPVAAGFDAARFAERLADAHVNAVIVAAKDLYGYCYYPSELGPAHPGLMEPDLLGKQVEACRELGIKVFAYYAYSWDEQIAHDHPEWLVWKRDRTTDLPQFGEWPSWSALCLSHPGLMEIALRQTTEIFEHCDPDGLWYDEVFPVAGECFCSRCLDELGEAGEDPFDPTVQRHHKHDLRMRAVRQLTEHVRSLRPGAQVDFNTQAVLGVRDSLPYLDNIEIEALPTGGWGYAFLPLHARYARTFGVPVYGMTARCLKHWGDHGGIKHPTQLRSELAGMVAHGLRCEIGADVWSDGLFDDATYTTIGAVYAEIERIEPYLEGAAPVAETAIVVGGLPLARFSPVGMTGGRVPSAHVEGLGGMAKLLTERQLQFDVVDIPAEFERYPLVVLPDSLCVDQPLAERLGAYLDAGGAVLASGAALRLEGTDRLWPELIGAGYAEPCPFKPAFMRLGPELLEGLAEYECFDFALYDGADRWRIEPSDRVAVHGFLSEPAVNRPSDAFPYSPPANLTDYATIVQAGRLVALSFGLGSSYYEHGYWIYRELFARLVQRLLPRPLVQTSAPQSAEVTVTHQTATATRGARWIVHVVNFSPLRRSLRSVEFLEDPIPLRDVEVRLALDAPVARVVEARGGAELRFARRGDRWVATVPDVAVAAMVVFEEECL